MTKIVLGLDANNRDNFYRTLIENYNDSPKTIIISTHLIEEAANVAGSAAAVDRFIADKSIIGSDSLGGLKTAYIWGKINKDSFPEDLEVTRLDLQKLFIKLTNV